MKKYVMLMLLLPALSAVGKVKLPSLLGDNAVLQQNTEVKFWGEATPDKELRITPSWDNKTVKVNTGKDGRWTASVSTPAGSFVPYEITFDDGEATTIGNVLIGEVWLASGQSNMEQTLYGYEQCPIENAAAEIVDAGCETGIRMFNVERKRSYEPQEWSGGEWMLPGVDTAPVFSAVSWFFAKSLTRALNVPVGMVTAAAGGSMIESWMSRELVERYPDIPTDPEGIEKMHSWLRPLGLYYAMICPIKNFTFKGILWYQGCSNVGKHETYAQRMAEMVKLWRDDMGQGDIPFYYVELAPFAHFDRPAGIEAALLREAQFKAQSLIPNSAMIPTNDLVEPYEVFNVHPRGKEQVGRRLSLAALKHTYGKDRLHYSGPQYKDLSIDKGEATVSFSNIPMGLCRTEGIEGFEIAGADKVFHPADVVKVDKRGGKITLRSGEVENPVAVRYCFRNFQLGNLIGAYELPAVPFRTDNW